MGRIAIARYFAVILDKDNQHLTFLGDHVDKCQLCSILNIRHPLFNLWKPRACNISSVAAGFDGYMALTTEGSVLAGPDAREFTKGDEVEYLRGVKDIVACEGHVVALHHDGTVTCIDESLMFLNEFREKVDSWHNIIQVAGAYDYILGLKNDGTLISVGDYYKCPKWSNVSQIATFNCYYSNSYTMAILADGRVVSDFDDEVQKWEDVCQISVGDHGLAVGLRRNGTAYVLGNDKLKLKFERLKNIVEIKCNYFNIVALLDNGDIISTF